MRGLSCPLILVVFLFVTIPVMGHVEQGTGNLQQFYSYYTSNPPVVNGCLTNVTTPEGTQGAHIAADADEWKDAYVRNMKMVTGSGSDTIDVTWFFMNDSHYLYVGFTANSNNLGNNMDINLVFDQGIGGGDHNDALEGGGAGVNNGEFRAYCAPTNLDITEYSFNGTAWESQNNNTEVFLALGDNFGISCIQSEWKIPLDTGRAVDDGHSYLNVGPYDELGLNIFYHTASQGTFYWSGTNNSMTDASLGAGWIDLRLGVKRDYVTFYATYDAHGAPTVDGNITGGATADDGWRGSYMRNLILTNFAGKTLNAALYCVDDVSAQDLYVGLKIYDDDNDATDTCVIYQEQDDVLATGRNFLLDNNRENALIANTTAYIGSRDRYWNAGSWAQDASSANQEAAGAWRTTNYEYEYRVNRSPATDDIIMNDGSLMGFHIRYHDAQDGTDYYWELSPNADRIQVDWNTAIYMATGWPDMQLGAPYFQVVYPEDNSFLEGVTNVRIFAQKSARDIDSAVFYRKSVPGTTYRLTKIGSEGEWSGTWDVTALPNGGDTLVFKVYDDALVMDRLVNVTIKNDASSVNTPPSVSLTAPIAGTLVGGTVNVTFTKSAAMGRTIDSTLISIDGKAFAATSAATSHSWNTVTLADGSHSIRLRVVDDLGTATMTETALFIVNNTPSVVIASPLDSSALSGKIGVAWTVALAGGGDADSCEISVDGISWRKTISDSADSIDTWAFADGRHSIQVRAYYYGHIGYAQSVQLLFGNAPSVAITAPRADSVVRGTVVVSFTAVAVAPAAMESTWISIDGGAWRATSTGTTDTLDTRPLTDGDHMIQIKVRDDNDRAITSSIVKVVVLNAPSILMTAPAADSVVHGTLIVRFTAAAVSPAVVESTWISVDGGAWRATSTGTTDTLDTRPLTDGDHTVQVKVRDDQGKSGLSGSVKFVVLNAPSISMTAPAADSVVHGTLIVRFTASAVSPAMVESTWISVDGGAFRATSTGATDTLDTQPLTDGTHIIQVRVMDDQGKFGLSKEVKITVANAPSVTLSYPAASSRISGIDTIKFSSAAVSPAVIESSWISIDGGEWVPATTAATYVLTTVDLLDGTHSAQVRVRDNNGKAGYSARVNFITLNSPSVEITDPVPGQYVSGVVVVAFSVETVSPSLLDSVYVSIDGGGYVPATTESTYVWDTRLLKDGEHLIKIRVRDDRGKLGESEVLLVKADNTAPLITSAGLYYGGLKAVKENGEVVFSALVFDRQTDVADTAVLLTVPSLGIDSLRLFDNGASGDTLSSDNVFSRAITATGLNSGAVVYSITAYDVLGNVMVLADTFFFDSEAPALTISVTPGAEDGIDSLNGNSYASRIFLKGVYTDGHSGVRAGRITVTDSVSGGKLLINSPIALDPVDSAFNKPVELTEGTNCITVLVEDWAGNSVTRQALLVYVPPKISKTVGEEGGTVESPNGTQVVIPEGALFSAVTIGIVRVPLDNLPKPEQAGVRLIGAAHDFTPDGLVFKKEVKVTLAYTEADLDTDLDGIRDIDETELAVYFLDNKRWILAGEAGVDTLENLVTVAVNHFTLYAVGTRQAAPSKLKSYWTHNPLSRSEQSTFIFDLPEDGTVGLSIFDQAGDLVRTLLPENTKKLAGSHAVKWDGSNGRNRFSGTGLYLYVFKVKSGSVNKVIKKPVAIINR